MNGTSSHNIVHKCYLVYENVLGTIRGELTMNESVPESCTDEIHSGVYQISAHDYNSDDTPYIEKFAVHFVTSITVIKSNVTLLNQTVQTTSLKPRPSAAAAIGQ